jgi:alpha-L-fucosidase 2
MLVQSHAGEISLLPALPSAWPNGAVTGLRVRGAVEVDLRWRGGKASEVKLRPQVDGEYTIRPPRQQRVGAITAGGTSIDVKTLADGSVRARFQSQRQYVLTFR